jgi:hypothetical protein
MASDILQNFSCRDSTALTMASLSEFILDLPGFKKIAKSIEQRAKRKSNLAHSEIPAISHQP